MAHTNTELSGNPPLPDPSSESSAESPAIHLPTFLGQFVGSFPMRVEYIDELRKMLREKTRWT